MIDRKIKHYIIGHGSMTVTRHDKSISTPDGRLFFPKENMDFAFNAACRIIEGAFYCGKEANASEVCKAINNLKTVLERQR